MMSGESPGDCPAVFSRKTIFMEDTPVQSKKPKIGKAKLIWTFLRGSKLMFVLSILMASLTALSDMITPQIVRSAVDNAIGGNEPTFGPWVMNIVNRFGGFEYLGRHLWIMAVAILVVAFVKVLSQYGYLVFNTRASETLTKTMRDMLYTHIEKLPFGWHMKNHTGDIIQRCTSDIDTTRNFVAGQLTSLFRICILVVLSMVFMFSMNPLRRPPFRNGAGKPDRRSRGARVRPRKIRARPL